MTESSALSTLAFLQPELATTPMFLTPPLAQRVVDVLLTLIVEVLALRLQISINVIRQFVTRLSESAKLLSNQDVLALKTLIAQLDLSVLSASTKLATTTLALSTLIARPPLQDRFAIAEELQKEARVASAPTFATRILTVTTTILAPLTFASLHTDTAKMSRNATTKTFAPSTLQLLPLMDHLALALTNSEHAPTTQLSSLKTTIPSLQLNKLNGSENVTRTKVALNASPTINATTIKVVSNSIV
jgi:hypothetical protein